MIHVFRLRRGRIDELALHLGVRVATYRAGPFAGGTGEHQLRGSRACVATNQHVLYEGKAERKREEGKKVDLTVEFPFRPEIVHRPPDRRPVPVLRRLLPRSAHELPLRLEVVLRLLHHSPLAPRRRVIRSSLPNEISLHSKVILVVVDRLPVHQTFLVEFLAVRCDRVHRLAPWDLQVILGQEIVGATVPPAKFQNSSVVERRRGDAGLLFFWRIFARGRNLNILPLQLIKISAQTANNTNGEPKLFYFHFIFLNKCKKHLRGK